MCDCRYIDRQVRQMIKNHPGAHLYQLVQIANKEHQTRKWDYNTIKNAANRLENKEKVASELTIIGGRAVRKLYLRGQSPAELGAPK